ncbi:glycoside hydrolase family 43 protein [Flavisericum labens]|uniref:glycoside hydrolase family 43 protein n=1 Tax=Flavisericum labens TaxID=3377112 RepID=UPI00387B956B
MNRQLISMKLNAFIFSFFCTAILVAQSNKPYVSDVWVADNDDGTYNNPIIYSDYSDPDVVRVGDDYYMTASSFNAAPGLPILHSKDMVNWKLINYALETQVPEETFNVPQHGNGVWAPAIRYHNDEIYIYWGDPDFGIYMVKTKDPYGKWDKPVLLMEGKGLIDPCPLWDDNGDAYLVHAYAGSRRGVKSLLTVNKMNAEGTEVIDKGIHVFDGHDNHDTVEGSKFYKRNGYYYIFAPAGGVATGWQLILRSKNVYGPYEEKVVLEQGSTEINGPHQGAWVDTPDGESWFYHFQDVGAVGRIVHLQPMSWKNDWPVMGEDLDGNGIGEPVKSHKKPNVGKSYPIVTPVETDNFDGFNIGLQWQWQANNDVVWHAKLPGKDYLRLFSIKTVEDTENLWLVPNLLLQKLPAPEFTASTKITLYPEEAKAGKTAGLIVMGMDYATLSISHNESGYFLEQNEAIKAIDGSAEKTNEKVKLKSNSAYFKVEVTAPDAMCQFLYSENGKRFKKIGKPFKAREGKWIGAKVGVFCISTQEAKRGGYADVDYFKISK